ncbi:ATP-dependent DNA helicase PcrA [Rubripirellula obstinata]|uniref:DNA 3'-5' helicase n=1 Tax=Rubripirellula obstinata TaxID=406547 RepID=A0A5B1CCT7_9BACT|nr:UvrD-helicase domain-containing protein [Rubripirellula obstinata]KAA1257775.1 ATP-dependent DNA helicase PcrA [Rubripirellula obstinata]
MDALTKELTPPQRDAVTHIDGPLLILAGPGSGKTRVVTHRVANMLGHGVSPFQIAALTFTNKAADEMRARVDKLAPGQPVWMGTFHRFCAQRLRRYASFVGLKENYSIYDSSDSKQAMKRAIAAAGISTTHCSPDQIASSISKAKNRLATPEMMEGHALSPQDAIAAKVYPVYQQQLLTANAVDFDDLLLHIARLLRENPEVRGELDSKYKYIMVDEYQDTNLAQYAIVRALSIDHPNLAVTGDPDQSIYGWRGADVNNILDFEKDYPNVKTVRLEKNYRSTPNILRAADELIRHNQKRKQKELFTDIPEGDPVVLRMYEDGYKEADGIVDDIADKIAGGQYKANDFAIFCRMNALTRSLEHAFRSRALPYQIVGGVEFYQRREIKDLLAYLHLINNPNHDVAFHRVINTPTRGIGAKTIERIRDHADHHRIPMLEAARHAQSIDGLAKRAKTMIGKFITIYDRISKRATSSLEDLIRYVVEETAYEDYVEKTATEQQDANPMANVDEFITATVEFDRQHPDDGSLDLFLEQVALVADTDKFDSETERVTLMTLHAAKGLEFPCVYIIGVEDDLIPHSRSKSTESEFEEERRLLFVGITRAMQNLQLSVCKRRAVRGDIRPVIPSPFLNELPLGEIKRIEAATSYDYFDDEFGDELNQDSYPESWDLPGENDPESGSGDDDIVLEKSVVTSFVDDVSQVAPPPPKAKPKPKPLLSGLKTGSDLLSGGVTPVTAYQEGVTVRHPDHGEGTIVNVTGRGPKRTAKVQFEDGEHSFRLAYAKLELVGKM